MVTLQITNNSPEAMRFLEFARLLPFVKEMTSERRTPPCQYTIEELNERVDHSMDSIRAGYTVTLEALRAKQHSRI